MKKIKLVYVSLLIIVLASFSTLSIGAEAKRAWMTSACYKFNLTAWDKFSEEVTYLAKFKITSSNGEVFIAERHATDHNSAMVVFPDDFHEDKLNISASIDCFDGKTYKWEIYVNDALIDNGTIGFTRNNPRNKLK